ncbi:MAG: hypothetical protein KC643_25765 [Nitrospira sp.]|nr:hypothetical protein [Nitrospira sp.]
MRKPILHHNRDPIPQEASEVVIEDVRFWRECPTEANPMGFLPMKLVFTADNINGILLFFESHGLMYSERAITQIRQEIETHGEANIWIVTHR